MHRRNNNPFGTSLPLAFPAALIFLVLMVLPVCLSAQCLDYGNISTVPEMGTFSLSLDGEITDAVPTPSPDRIDLDVFPNPVTPRTTLAFELSEAGSVNLEVFKWRGGK